MQIDMKRVDPEINMDRFYCVELTKDLFGVYGIHRQWGRSGSWGHHRLDWCGTEFEAESALSELVSLKLARGYLLKEPHLRG
jgi:predicted DNA-binding WGR domain protein